MFEIFVILICISLNALLAGSEMAFVASDRFVLKALSDSGSKRGQLFLKLRKHPERFLSIIQLGISFVGAFAAAIGGAGAQATFAPWISDTFGLSRYATELLSTFLIVIPLTYVSVVFGELVPKTIALRKPIAVATRLVYPLMFVNRLLRPLVWVFESSTKAVVNLVFSEANASKSRMFDVKDVVSEQGKQYMINMVKIEKSTIRDVLLPWNQVDALDIDDSLETVERRFITSGHTRLPVMDNRKVAGILNSKEFFAFQKTDDSRWQSLVRQPVQFTESTSTLKALKTLQEASAHMAIVLRKDHLVGVVTLEDILEEIVGDIYDEDDYGSIQRILRNSRY